MGYWSYYAGWLLLSMVLAEPRLLVGIVVFLLLRRFVPSPAALFRALKRGRALREQLAINPSNVTAARDLAQIRLDLRRPKSALGVIETALKRSHQEPELLYLSGVALHRMGRHEDALPRLVESVSLDARLRFGMPYFVAGEALFELGRWEEAIDAYERYLSFNGSDALAHTKLARALRRHGTPEEVQAALDEAKRCLHYNHWFRGNSFRHWFAVHVARATFLHDIGAAARVAAVGLVVLALVGGPALWLLRPYLLYPDARDHALARRLHVPVELLVQAHFLGEDLRPFDARAETALDGFMFTADDGRGAVEALRESVPAGVVPFVLEQESELFGTDATVAVVRADSVYDVMKALGTNGANHGLSTDDIIARLESWNQRFGVRVFGASFDWVAAEFVHPPTDMDAFAEEVYAFCPDTVDQGAESVDRLATYMLMENRVSMWWD